MRGQLWTQITWTQDSFWWHHTQSVHSQGLALVVVSYGGCRHTLDLNKHKAAVKSSIFSAEQGDSVVLQGSLFELI